MSDADDQKVLMADKGKRIERLLGEFDANEKSYRDFELRLRGLIESLLVDKSLNIHNITSRTKERSSFIKKITKPGKDYLSISEVTDLCGIRITTYFENSVDAVRKVIENEFEVDYKNSVDKRKLHGSNAFGYMSLHYVVSLKKNRYELPEYRNFKGVKAELQIRSILQHAWAEVEHDLGYKSRVTIPEDLRRRFSILSGLLEIADREFLLIREEIAQYENKVRDLLEEDRDELLVDKISIRLMSAHHEGIKEQDIKICALTGARLVPSDDFSEVVAEMLRWIGVERIYEMMKKFRMHEDKIRDFANIWISQRNYDEFNSGISLMYLVYILIGRERTVDEINAFAQYFRRGKHVENFGERLKSACVAVFPEAS